jgi:hypothetical protein
MILPKDSSTLMTIINSVIFAAGNAITATKNLDFEKQRICYTGKQCPKYAKTQIALHI